VGKQWVPGTKSTSEIKLSSGETETMRASEASKLAMHCRNLAEELGISTTERINLEVDATVAIAFADNTHSRSNMKHLDVREAWIRDLRNKDLLTLIKVWGKVNPADFYTKLLPASEYKRHIKKKKVDKRPTAAK
jgi:C4-dicarboxylate transporter